MLGWPGAGLYCTWGTGPETKKSCLGDPWEDSNPTRIMIVVLSYFKILVTANTVIIDHICNLDNNFFSYYVILVRSRNSYTICKPVMPFKTFKYVYIRKSVIFEENFTSNPPLSQSHNPPISKSHNLLVPDYSFPKYIYPKLFFLDSYTPPIHQIPWSRFPNRPSKFTFSGDKPGSCWWNAGDMLTYA